MPERVNSSSPKRAESGRIAGVTCSSQSISRRGDGCDPDVLRGAAFGARASGRSVVDVPKGVTLLPGGLVPSTSGKDKSPQHCAPTLSIIVDIHALVLEFHAGVATCCEIKQNRTPQHTSQPPVLPLTSDKKVQRFTTH